MNMPEVIIQKRGSSANDFFYDFIHEHGSLDATFNQVNKWFGISNVDVEVGYRRQGIGKLLIRKSVEKAEELEARMVYSAILSRECLEAMEGVFGKGSLIIISRGTYTRPGEADKYDADAMLWHEVKPSYQT